MEDEHGRESKSKGKVYIFTGPTLSATEAEAEFPAVYLPPVSQGDVHRIGLRRPLAIGIIDGYFQRMPAVWHKEILWVMQQGVHVFGSASLGALRAAELHAFGMIGVGAIFEAFRDGLLEDDDEVAVVHGSAETGYRPVSEAMVNIRFTLDSAVKAAVIGADTAEALKRLAKERFYPERTYANLVHDAKNRGLPSEEIEALRDWLPAGRVNQKRDDALSMLRVIRSEVITGLEPKVVRYRFEYTHYWDQFCRESAFGSFEKLSATEGEPLLDSLIREEICLLDNGWKNARTACLMRLLAVRESRRLGMDVTPEQLEDTAFRFRLSRNLQDPADVERWHESNFLTRDDLLRLIEDEARISWIETMFGSEILIMLPDYLRSTSAFQSLRTRAQEKHRLLEANGLNDQGLEAAGVTDEELLRWYFEKRLGLAVPGDIETKARDMGFGDSRALKRSTLKEWHYVRLVENRSRPQLTECNAGTPNLEPGDPAPTFTLPSRVLGPISIDRLAGRPLLLVFSPKQDPLTPAARDHISQDKQPLVICIFRRLGAAESLVDTPYISLLDRDGVVHRRYGNLERCAVLLDSGHRVLKVLPLVEGQITEALLESAKRPCEKISSTQAPVLVIPKVLDYDLCRSLLLRWQAGGNEPAGVLRLTASGPKDLLDREIKRRRDHILQPGSLESRVRDLVSRRVYPELIKAFHFEVRGYEQFKIGCYHAGDEGHFHAHRDNSNPATHYRRYSMSINLNTGEYEGGFVCFPEFGSQNYRPDTGSAFVFSSSLLHEVMPVRSGARFALITFFLGDFK